MQLPAYLRATAGFILPLIAFSCASAFGAIDRQALVGRHAVHVDRIDPESPLSVGNGDFAFTVDVTGLQTFETKYHAEGIPLETLSTWAWHSFPNTAGVKLDDAMVSYNFHGRDVKFAGLQHSPAGTYFRENPHPVALGQISLWLDGRLVTESDLTAIDQKLDLWIGVIRSSYLLGGQPVTVETVAHAELSQVGVRIESPLVGAGRLQVRWHFPYSYKFSTRNKPPFVWDQPEKHRTTVARTGENFCELERAIDETKYRVSVQWEGAAKFTEAAPHDFRLQATGGDALAFTCGFSGDARAGAWPAFAATKESGALGWKKYWTKGGVIDLSGSTDPRAAELERRVVLSQYLLKVNYAGSMPPGEDGLTNITWYGKHNSEMYFWHAAQFYQWGHPELLEKGLAWYQKILPSGKVEAAGQGFEGVRWPKMAGLDGRTTPGTINPFIIWNQPNPIALCELVYRAHPDRATLEKYQEMVFESAKFLASFAFFDPVTKHYVLGPPIKNVSESSGENNTRNPTFELAYWYYGLQVAQTWRARLGLAPEPKWADILAKLTPLPIHEGKYLEIETFPEMYQQEGTLPLSMLMAFGFMPRTPLVDPEIIRATFAELNRRHGVGLWVSWAMGQGALTAARLGEGEMAVNIVTHTTGKWRFMNNGHVRRPKEPDNCPAYLPVNGALLTAVGLMAGGWDGAPAGNAPGFPQNGKWHVRWEGLNPMP